MEFTEGAVRDMSGIRSRDEYGSRRKPAFEVMTMDTVQSYSNLQAYGGKLREKRAEFWSRKFNDVSTRVALGEKTENENSNLTSKRNEYHISGDKGLGREVIKVLSFLTFPVNCFCCCLPGADVLFLHDLCRTLKYTTIGG